MKFSYTPARLAVLGLSLSACVPSLLAQPNPAALPETVVTAARLPQAPSLVPQDLIVITAEQIRASGVGTANEAIRWLGGVVGRVDTSGGRDQTLDLRGFGEAASSNAVFLVDGVRQNEGDSSGLTLSWIPVESIERIEIVRGNGAVLYGEGATGGVINIITNKGLAETGGMASVGLGSHATRDVRASVRTVQGPWRLQVHANAFDTDNHRDNFHRQERSALARATWVDGAAQWSFQWGAQSAQGGLPGGIAPADFPLNSRRSYKPLDNGQTEKRNFLVTGEWPVGDWQLAVDLSHRTDQSISRYVADAYRTSSDTHANRAGLRAWRNLSRGDVKHRWLIGVDSERWGQDRDEGATVVSQASDAVYARHEADVRSLGLKLIAGVRQTMAKRDITGNAVGSLSASNASWDLGAAFKLGSSGEVFGRLGTSFRLPNADEFACYPYPGGPACAPVTLLRPQTSQDAELGYRQQLKSAKWSARYYQSALKNEIGYDPALGNTNFDPTQREGIEIDSSAMLGRSFDVGAQYALRRAIFREGVYAGRTVPMVPTQSLTARMTYRLSPLRTLSLSSQWVSSQKITEDFNNTCAAEVPAYAVTNLRYSEKVHDWIFSASVNNLADKRYYNYRTRCSTSQRSVYPEAGRTVFVSAQRRF